MNVIGPSQCQAQQHNRGLNRHTVVAQREEKLPYLYDITWSMYISMYGVGGWDKEIYMTLKEKNIRMKRKQMWATGLYKASDNGAGPTHGIVAIAMIDHDDDLPTRRPNTRNTNPQSHCSDQT